MANSAYAVTNALASLAASAFTPTAGPSDDTRLYLTDARLDRQYVFTARSSNNSVKIDLGSATSISGWAILNHNLNSIDAPSSAYGVTIYGADDAGFSVNLKTWTLIFGSTQANAPNNKDVVIQIEPTSRRYWQVYFFWTTGTKTLKIGELFAYATSTQFSRGMVDGSGETERYVVATAEMQYGETRASFRAGPIRERSIRTADFSTTERDELLTMWRATKGPVTPMLLVDTYEATVASGTPTYTSCMYGRLMLPEFAWQWSDYNRVKPPELVLRNLGREVGS